MISPFRPEEKHGATVAQYTLVVEWRPKASA